MSWSQKRAWPPPGWEATRRRILERDNYRCQLGYDGCTIYATEVDHLIPMANRVDHSDENLQAVCKHCHNQKTRKEISEGLRRYVNPAKRVPPAHPGLIKNNTRYSIKRIIISFILVKISPNEYDGVGTPSLAFLLPGGLL